MSISPRRGTRGLQRLSYVRKQDWPTVATLVYSAFFRVGYGGSHLLGPILVCDQFFTHAWSKPSRATCISHRKCFLTLRVSPYSFDQASIFVRPSVCKKRITLRTLHDAYVVTCFSIFTDSVLPSPQHVPLEIFTGCVETSKLNIIKVLRCFIHLAACTNFT